MSEISRDELILHLNLIRGDIAGVHDRLDALNGRTRTTEQTLAVLQERIPGGPKQAAAWGGGIAGVVVAITEVARWFVK